MNQAKQLHVQEIVVVEGLHDKQAVDRAVAADVWVIGGDRVAQRFVDELRRASAARGVIIFTDPDGPGERIRRRLAVALPASKHAFLTQTDARSRDGHRIGVEFATPEDIAVALIEAKATVQNGANTAAFTMRDLQAAGLVNHAQAALRRKTVGEALHIGYANGKSFLYKLNALGVSRQEWERVVSQVLFGEISMTQD